MEFQLEVGFFGRVLLNPLLRRMVGWSGGAIYVDIFRDLNSIHVKILQDSDSIQVDIFEDLGSMYVDILEILEVEI